MRVRARWGRVVAALALAGWCGPALAWTGEVAWPTFYRSGPDKQYKVLEELDRGVMLDVLSCQDGWCQVQNGRTLGFVEQSTLLAPGAVPLKPANPPASAACFESRSTSYDTGETFRYCSRPASP